MCMLGSCSTRKALLCLFCIVAAIVLRAQDKGFRFFPVKEQPVLQQVMAGVLDGRFFLMNQPSSPGLHLYIYDTSTQTGTTRSYAFPLPVASVQVQDRVIRFLATTREQEGLAADLLELDKEGRIIRRQHLALPGLQGPVRLLTSHDSKLWLFSQVIRKNADSAVLRAVLAGVDGKIRKQLLYSFRHHAELEADPELFLDKQGNTHIMVYDKYTNYRMSSDLTVNTVPVNEELIVSETFTFEKVKLKTMRLFQDNGCNCLKAEGLYVDGSTRNNKGIYSVVFPAVRKNELAPRFIPFTTEMIRSFRKGFSATDAMVQNSLQLQDMLYTDSGSIAVLRLAVGMPQRVDDLRFQSGGGLMDAFSRSLAVSRASDISVAVSTATGSSTRASSTTPRVRQVAGGDKYANAAPLQGGMPGKTSPLSSRSTGRNAPKLLFIKLDQEQGFSWYGSRPLDVFNAPGESYNRQYLSAGPSSEVQVLLYQADQQEEPYPYLVTFRNGRQSQQKLPEKKMLFSPLQFLSHDQYASLYLNTETGEAGIWLIGQKE